MRRRSAPIIPSAPANSMKLEAVSGTLPIFRPFASISETA